MNLTGSYQYFQDSHPRNFRFGDGVASVTASENGAAQVAKFAEQYFSMANMEYREDQIRKAKQIDSQKRQKLEEEARDAEQRLRVLERLRKE